MMNHAGNGRPTNQAILEGGYDAKHVRVVVSRLPKTTHHVTKRSACSLKIPN